MPAWTVSAHVNGTARVFVARLAGLAVFDPLGDQVGKVRDVVATLRPDNRPRASSVWSSKCSLAGVVCADDPCHLHRPGPGDRPDSSTCGASSSGRPGLVLGELLDRTVELVTDGAGARVAEEVTVDVAMEQQHARLAAHQSRRTGSRAGFRRRGESSSTGPISAVSPRSKGTGCGEPACGVRAAQPADLAQVLHEMSHKRRVEVAAALDDEKLADVLEEAARGRSGRDPGPP